MATIILGDRYIGQSRKVTSNTIDTAIAHERHSFNYILATVCFATFFIPDTYVLPEFYYRIWQYAICIIGFGAALAYFAHSKITSRWVFFCLAFLAYYIISTLLSGSNGNLRTAVFFCTRGVGIVSLLEYGFSRDEEATLVSFITASLIMCAICYITFIIYKDIPGGMKQGVILSEGRSANIEQHYFLFTHDNGTAFYFLPTLAVFWFYVFEYRQKLIPFACAITAAILYMYLSLWSVTALFATISFCAFIVVCLNESLRNKLARVLTFRLACVIGVCFCVGVVVLMNNGTLDHLTENLGKMHARDYIWRNSVYYISQNPFFGSGYELGITTEWKLGMNHCHNVILQILYTGGFLSLFLFAGSLFNCRPKHGSVTGAVVLIVYVIIFFIVSTFDWYLYMTPAFVPFVVLACCGDDESKSVKTHADELTNKPNDLREAYFRHLTKR